MLILNSLKVNGKFYYAPSLKFIEKYLDQNKFKVENHKVGVDNFESTIITKLNG